MYLLQTILGHEGVIFCQIFTKTSVFALLQMILSEKGCIVIINVGSNTNIDVFAVDDSLLYV